MRPNRSYRDEARLCERMAAKTSDPEIRAAWLRLAADWQGMDARDLSARRSREATFDECAQAMGTGEDDRTASH